MAITLVESDTSGAMNGDSITFNFGTLAENDVVVVVHGGAAHTAVIDHPTGYTEIIQLFDDVGGDNDSAHYLNASYKIMGASPDTSVTVPGSGNRKDGHGAVYYVLRGVDTTNVPDTTPVTAHSNGVLSDVDPPSITTVTDEAWVIAGAGVQTESSAPSTFPSGYSNGLGAGEVDSNRGAVAAATKEIVSAGSEDPSIFDWGGQLETWFTATFAIRPDSATSAVNLSGSASSVTSINSVLETTKSLIGSISSVTSSDGALNVLGNIGTPAFFTASDVDTTTITVSDVTSSVGDVLVVMASIKVDEIDQASISDTEGLTWTERVTDTGAIEHNQRIWTATANGNTTDITVSGWPTACHNGMQVVVVPGAEESIGATASNTESSNSTSITVAITTEESDSILLSFHSANNSEGSVPTGFTAGAQTETSGTSDSTVATDSAYKTSSGGNDDHTWNNGAFRTDRNVAAIEVKAASDGAGNVDLSGSASSVTSSSGILQEQETLVGSVTSVTSTSGVLQTTKDLAGTGSSVTSSVASLSRGIEGTAFQDNAFQVDTFQIEEGQFLQVDEVVFVGSWTDHNSSTAAEDIATALAGETANDATYAQSELTPSQSALVFKFQTALVPINSEDHVYTIRYRKNEADGDTINLTFEIREGYVDENNLGTLIHTTNFNDISETIAEASDTLTTNEAGNITDYTKLFGRVVANAS